MIRLTKLFLAISLIFCANVFAAGDVKHPKEMKWPFEGITGKFDRASIQRGFDVYKQVCASCHSMNLLYYRNLEEVGFSAEQIKQIAANYTVKDGFDDAGDTKERPALPSDRFASPYSNPNAAKAANNGAVPPDLSLIIKARPNGANYVYSLLTGYENPPEGFELMAGLNYNPYFPGKQLSMASPLSEGLVEYADGTQATVDQMAYDVVNFLQWAAEREMEARKSIGIKAILYLSILSVLFFFAKKRVWKNVE